MGHLTDILGYCAKKLDARPALAEARSLAYTNRLAGTLTPIGAVITIETTKRETIRFVSRKEPACGFKLVG